MTLKALLALLLLPLPALAQDDALPSGPPMSIEAFEDFVTGKTMTYAEYGEVYGIEQYLPGRRAAWRRGEGMCEYGDYYVLNGHICFQYGNDGIDHCWDFWPEGDRLIAVVAGDQVPSTVALTPDSLNCPGPLVGVKY